MSTGQIIGGVIGGVIGFFAGGNVVQGAMIGASIGGALDPQKIDGPHLQDRKVQISTYGAAIPIIYGGDAGSGNVIWSADLQEHDVESSGKGGPTVTNRTYTVSCAILIGEGPIAGIRRIWADAKLVYDISSTSEVLEPSTSIFTDTPAQAASELFASYFTFYPGTEDQLPDPTMEAALGVGNVPAYLGSCYIVFTDLPVTPYGNRIPNFRFETSEEPTTAGDENITYEPLKVYDWSVFGQPQNGQGDTTYSYGATVTNDFSAAFAAYSAAEPDKLVYQGYTSWGTGGSAGAALAPIMSAFPSAVGQSLNAAGTGSHGSAEYARGYYNNRTADFIIDDMSTAVGTAGATCGSLLLHGVSPSTDPDTYLMRTIEYPDPGSLRRLYPGHHTPPAPWDSGDVGNNCIDYPSSGGYFPFQTGFIHAFILSKRVPSIPADIAGCPVGDPCLLGEPAQVPGHPNFCIACDGTITPSTSTTYEKITGTAKQLAAVEYRDGVLYQNGLGPVLLPSDPNYSDSAYWAEQAALAIAAGTLRGDVTTPVVVSEYAKGTGVTVDLAIAGEANTTLDAIVADICERAGMPDGTYNVTELEGIPVQGYAIARQMPARAAILQTQQAFFWDFVESGREIKAVLRGADPLDDVIGLDDLGATESEEPIVAVVPTRAQEAEMPATLNLAYPVRKTGYETGTQRSRRLTTTSKQVMSVEISVVMEDQKAADVVGALMYAAWTNRVQRQWSTTRKWAHLEPTDVRKLNDGEFEYVVRITDRSEEGGVIKWKGVDEQPAAYHPISSPGSVTGTSGDGYSLSVRFDGPSRLELIDSPIVYDGNDDPGHYAAAAGYRSPWPGEVAMRSIDGGTTWVETKTMTNTATMGHATTVLGDFDGGNVVDERNTVNVQMHSGSIATITRAQLLNGGNLAILGDELLMFQRADLIAENTYSLTGLLRGRFGTEQHMGTHTATDRFVLFTPAVYRVADTLSGLNVAAQWKPVTLGQTTDDANAIDFTNTGAGLKPLSVAHLVAIDAPNGQKLIRWVHRTRYGGAWRDGVDVPLAETSEEYAAELRDASDALVASATLTTPQWLVSGAFGLGFTLSQPSFYLRGVGALLAGINGGQTITYDATGALGLRGNNTGEISTQLADDGDFLFVSTINGSLLSHVFRYDITTMGAPTHSFLGTLAADCQGVAYDGTDVWVSQSYSDEVKRLSAADLSVLNTYTVTGHPTRLFFADGYVWATCTGSGELAQIDISDGSIAQRITASGGDVVAFGGLVFTASGTEISSYEISGGAPVDSAPFIANSVWPQQLALHDGSVYGADRVTHELVQFSATTGEFVKRIFVAGLEGICGSDGTNLFLKIAGVGTVAYAASDFTGYSVTVYQLSSTVGRGFPATVALT